MSRARSLPPHRGLRGFEHAGGREGSPLLAVMPWLAATPPSGSSRWCFYRASTHSARIFPHTGQLLPIGCRRGSGTTALRVRVQSIAAR